MRTDYSSYLNALASFYEEVAWWKYAQNTENHKEELSRIKHIKRKAQFLLSELESLPDDMKDKEVLSHIEKALML